MRKDSLLVACSLAASILLLAATALVPASAWRAAFVMAHLAPTLVSTAGGHGNSAVRAAQIGVFAAPGLLREPAPASARPERQVKVCRRDLPRSCAKPECPRQLIQRLHFVFPTSG
jgi:hypothetical protein